MNFALAKDSRWRSRASFGLSQHRRWWRETEVGRRAHCVPTPRPGQHCAWISGTSMTATSTCN